MANPMIDSLWQLAGELRATIPASDRAGLLSEAVDRGLHLPWRDVSAFAQTGGATADIVDPAIVADFLIAFTSQEGPRRTLDPWAGLGITLAALAEHGRITHGLAIEINASLSNLASRLWPDAQVRWETADAAVGLAGDIGEFDLIVGSPPIGLARHELHSTAPPVDLRASKTYTMVVQAGMTLATSGTMAIVLPESFWLREGRVRAALAAISVYPCATLALPRRSFGTSIPMCLAIFTHDRHDLLFAGELDPTTDTAAVVANLRARRPGRLPQLGVLVPAEEYSSWARLLRGKEIEAIASAAGLRAMAVKDLADEVRIVSAGREFDPDPTAVYVPKSTSRTAVTSLEALGSEHSQYLQVLVRPDVLDPGYAAGFLNSPLGQKVREQLATGSTLPTISTHSLRAGSLYLPPRLSQQQAAARAGREMADLQRDIRLLYRDLWEHPLAAERVQGKVRRLIEGDGVDQWMDSLPFPLASILWRYVAEQSAKQRCEYLIHFFEATAIFLVNLHLSAYGDDRRLIDGVPRRADRDTTYRYGSIGIWSDLFSRLAGHTRKLLADDAGYALEAFRTEDRRRLDRISSKDLSAALKDEASAYRRNWIGHPAPVGRSEWESRLGIAEATLGRIRETIADAFVGWHLIRPGAGVRRGGVVATDVEYLAGSRSLFRGGSVALRDLPEEGALYMLEDGASLLLPLRHLFQVRRSPESAVDACYFYDRLEDDGIRWVSYHYEAKAEVVDSDDDTQALIEELGAIG